MNFEFFSVPRIVFGRGKVGELGGIAACMGRSVLIVHNGGEVGDGGAVDQATDSLRAAGVRCSFHRQRGEPAIEDVEAGLAIARRDRCEVIIGLGGGSAIDCAKAVAGLVISGGSVLDYLEVIGGGKKITLPTAPWIAVPTTAGTGAEVTRNAVVASAKHRYKASLRSEHLLAQVALIDVELGIDTPPAVTAASGMDALVQLIEAYTSRGANPITDALALKGIALAGGSLSKAFHNGTNLDARQNMAMAAMLSGITLTNAGLGAVHGFAAPIGANFPIPHGVICANLLAPVILANAEAANAESVNHPLIEQYGMLGERLAGHAGSMYLVNTANSLVKEMRIPPLSEFGMKEADIAIMVALARKSSSMKFNPVALSDEALGNALRAAI